jgi:pimeloyl-ACP methyl ester carboxylesterase
MDATQFAPQLDYLSDRYRAISYNSRVLTGAPEPHSLADLVEDCRSLLDQLDIRKCVLAGMSVGGFMALQFALTYQDRLDGLILIDATAQSYTPEEQEAYHHEFGKLDIDGMLPRAFAEWAASYCFGKTAYTANKPLVDYWTKRWTTTVPARAVLYQARSWINKDDLTSRLGEIKVPVLIIHGEEDVPVPIERAIPMLDMLPNATLCRIPRAGHTSNLENEQAVNEAIGEFLASTYGG